MTEISREELVKMIRTARVTVVEQWEGAYGYVPPDVAATIADAILARLAAKDEAEPVASSADTANKPFVWMNFEHLEAYRAGKRGGVAWVAPERSDFYSVALYTSEPKAEAPTAAQDEAEPVAWRYHYGDGNWRLTQDEPINIRTIKECAVESLYATSPTAAKDEARERGIEAALARRLCQLFDSGGESQRSVRARHASALFQLLDCDAPEYLAEQKRCDADPVRYLEQAEARALSPSNPTRQEGQ